MTKLELERDLTAANEALKSQQAKVYAAEAELRREKDQSARYEKNWRESHDKLLAIGRVIASTLDVKYRAEVSDASQYQGWPTEPKDQPCEEVRLLRHLFRLADVSVPF